MLYTALYWCDIVYTRINFNAQLFHQQLEHSEWNTWSEFCNLMLGHVRYCRYYSISSHSNKEFLSIDSIVANIRKENPVLNVLRLNTRLTLLFNIPLNSILSNLYFAHLYFYILAIHWIYFLIHYNCLRDGSLIRPTNSVCYNEKVVEKRQIAQKTHHHGDVLV